MLTAQRGTDHRPDQATALVDGADAASTSVPSRVDEFSRFYREYMPLLTHQIMASGWTDPTEAADIAQETMISVYRRWTEIDSPRAYSSRVAQHMSYSCRARADRRRRLTEQMERDPLLQVAEPGPDQAYGERERIRELINLLPPVQRTVVAAISDGMSTSEVADKLGLRASTVRTHLQLARRKLHDQLTADDEV